MTATGEAYDVGDRLDRNVASPNSRRTGGVKLRRVHLLKTGAISNRPARQPR